jgi:hypothetical protein
MTDDMMNLRTLVEKTSSTFSGNGSTSARSMLPANSAHLNVSAWAPVSDQANCSSAQRRRGASARSG